MPLIVEDGNGLADANSYASLEEFADFAANHLYPGLWTAASDGRREVALIHASRTINTLWRFNGAPATSTQALDWPRASGTYPDPVPARLRDATCELALALLAENRLADPAAQGISHLGLGQGALDITFDKSDRKPFLPDIVKALLGPLGRPAQGGGTIARVGRAY